MGLKSGGVCPHPRVPRPCSFSTALTGGLEPDPLAPEDPEEPASSLQLNGDTAQSRGDTGLRVDCREDSATSICPGTTRSQLPPAQRHQAPTGVDVCLCCGP